jgi:flagellar hook-associated protein 3 FlgL
MIQFTGAVSQQFLSNLELLQEQMATTQNQISSGTQISKPSDAPNSLGDVLQLESDIGNVTQVTSNLNLVQGQVNSAETALEGATQLLDQAASIAAQGVGTTVSATARATLSQEAQGVLASLVSASQTQFNGNYVFSGDQPTSPSYQLDPSSPDGVDQLITAPSTALIQDASGITFSASETAQQIFDNRNPDGTPATNNVFAAVNGLAVALANNDQAGITSAVSSIQAAQAYMSQQVAFYGGVQDQITNAIDIAQKFQLQDQTSLSQLTSTNVAAASVSLTQDQTDYQASIEAESSLPKTNLFSYLSGS